MCWNFIVALLYLFPTTSNIESIQKYKKTHPKSDANVSSWLFAVHFFEGVVQKNSSFNTKLDHLQANLFFYEK